MKKRCGFLLLTVVFAVALCLNAFAVFRVNKNYKPSLTFSGSTATCSLVIREPGKTINATLELWQGSTKIAAWTKSGNSYVIVTGSRSVTSGQTYTLKAHGTIDGTAITATSVTRICP